MIKEKVAAVKCRSYDKKLVEKAIVKSLDLINFKFKKNTKVLIKPNIVGDFPKNQLASTTHPALIEAICKILKKNNCKIYIGDSPFMSPEASFRASGMDKLAKKYGKLVIFEQDKLIRIKDKKAKALKTMTFAKTLKDVDLIINVPKMKTHMLSLFTGAVKNLYGCIPGGMKQKIHLKHKGDKQFSKVLIDIYQNIKPELNIMDGVVGMEGEGPTAGTAKKSGLILASKNSIALDIAATKIIGIKKTETIKEAIKRKLYPKYSFELVGMKKLPKIKFKPPSSQSRSQVQGMINKLFKERPIICDRSKCIKCCICAKHCPAKAISMKPYPVVDPKKCIRCFCCIEVCPHQAIGLKGGPVKLE
jgi:uncharacterized protein (DUF362 family)